MEVTTNEAHAMVTLIGKYQDTVYVLGRHRTDGYGHAIIKAHIPAFKQKITSLAVTAMLQNREGKQALSIAKTVEIQ